MIADILGPFNDATTKFISENGILKQRLERLVLFIIAALSYMLYLL